MKTDEEILQEIKPGCWVVITEDGLRGNGFSVEESIVFNTKKEAIEDTACAFLDGRKHRTVRRISAGRYRYDLPDIDDRSERHFFLIVKVTEENLAEIKALGEATLDED